MYASKQIYGLQEIFNELSYSHNQAMSQDVILEFLDSRCPNGHFDRDVFQQLIEQVKPAQNGRVTINEFIDVVLRAQGILNDKLINCNKLIDEKALQVRQCSEKLNQSKFTETGSSMSRINVEVIEAQLMYKTNGSLQISIQVGAQIKQTQFSLKSQLFWQESFDFNVYSQKELIEIILVDSELSPVKEIGGIVQLSLDLFSDQLLHDIWVELGDRYGSTIRAKLHLKVQWIYSVSTYLSEKIRIEQQQIDELKQQAQDHQMDLDLIAQPFLKPPKRLDEISKPSVPVVIQSYATQPQNEQLIEHIDRLVKLSLLFIIVYMIVSLLASFQRCLYFDFLVMFYCFVFYQKNHKLQSLLHIKVIIVLLGIVILMDIVWLSIYSTPYFAELSLRFIHYEYSLEKYEVVISWILLILKITIIGFYVHIYAIYPDKSTQVYDQQWQSIFGRQFL